MNKIKIIVFALVMIFIVSCSEKTTDLPEQNIGTITYSANIEPIIYNNCWTCHSGVAASGGLDLTTYQNVRTIAEEGISSYFDRGFITGCHIMNI